MDIYIGNINLKLEEKEISKLFEVFGPVSSITLVKDKESGKSKGFGFVSMENAQHAKRAIDELHNIELAGRRLVVYEAKQKTTKIAPVQKPLENRYNLEKEDEISFNIPKDFLNDKANYKTNLTGDGFVKVKFNS